MYLAGENRYMAVQDNLTKIPGSPVAYWVSSNVFELFLNEQVSKYFISRVGLMTTDNDRFLRFFWEVRKNDICFCASNNDECRESGLKWFPHNKGGTYRKWAGNREYVVDWQNNGERIKNAAIQKYPYLKGNPKCFFKIKL